MIKKGLWMCLTTYRCSGRQPSLFFSNIALICVPENNGGVNMKMLKGFLLLFLVLVWIFPVSAFADDIVVIVNEHYPLSSVQLSEVKKIYLGEKKFEGNLQLKVLDQRSSSTIRTKFITEVISITPEAYYGYWLKKFFQEGGFPPLVKDNSLEVIDAVIKDKGSIGYIWGEEANGKNGIKIILIIKGD